MINVFFVDDHEIVRHAVAQLINGIKGVKVIAEASNGREALDVMESGKINPDVVLMDLTMPVMDGLEATRKLRYRFPKMPILIITAQTNEPHPTNAMKVGANGYIHKGCDLAELERGIRTVATGERYLSDEMARTLAFRLLREYEGSPFDQMSLREREVLHLIIIGERNNKIAEMLTISPKTISTYRYRILGKLGVKNRMELLRLAKQFSFYPEGEEPAGVFDELR
jgi:two-component system invasion response regulator UvrY